MSGVPNNNSMVSGFNRGPIPFREAKRICKELAKNFQPGDRVVYTSPEGGQAIGTYTGNVSEITPCVVEIDVDPSQKGFLGDKLWIDIRGLIKEGKTLNRVLQNRASREAFRNIFSQTGQESNPRLGPVGLIEKMAGTYSKYAPEPSDAALNWKKVNGKWTNSSSSSNSRAVGGAGSRKNRRKTRRGTRRNRK
jgi:hypothetical protein